MRKLGLASVIFCFIICMGSGIIYLDNLYNYANQDIPSYITLDNTDDNFISDELATLGRVLFYDKQLSLDNRTSCASCHQQDVAFGDTDQVSTGSFGITGRHSMRLVNARFSAEERFFWDERASTLEEQTTMPIQDAIEMGYSGQFGDPDISGLIEKMEDIDYYDTLFEFAFGDNFISEERMQLALAQFVRSIQSFDSRYDSGRMSVAHDSMPFPNFTMEENRGKRLFLRPVQFGNGGNRIGGGIGCAGCHNAPEFSISSNSRTNGVILAANGFDIDEGINRSPTLRDIFNPVGELNGPLMHNGLFDDISQVIEHYNDIETATGIPNIVVDPRLKNGAFTQKLNMTEEEKSSVIAFLKTLTGIDVYTNEKWSDPFDDNGNIEVLLTSTSTQNLSTSQIVFSPNPVVDHIRMSDLKNVSRIDIININGQVMMSVDTDRRTILDIDVSNFENGVYVIRGVDKNNDQFSSQKFVKL